MKNACEQFFENFSRYFIFSTSKALKNKEVQPGKNFAFQLAHTLCRVRFSDHFRAKNVKQQKEPATKKKSSAIKNKASYKLVSAVN